MKIPQTISITGIRYSVIKDHKLAQQHNCYGYTSYTDQIIVLDPKLKKDMLEATFIHEITHIIFNQFGLNQGMTKEEEEHLVTVVANGTYHALIDNGLVK